MTVYRLINEIALVVYPQAPKLTTLRRQVCINRPTNRAGKRERAGPSPSLNSLAAKANNSARRVLHHVFDSVRAGAGATASSIRIQYPPGTCLSSYIIIIYPSTTLLSSCVSFFPPAASPLCTNNDLTY